MRQLLFRAARVIGAALGAVAGLIVLQVLRLRRLHFLPGHPGFYINRTARPQTVDGGAPPLRLIVFGDSTVAGVGVDRAEDALPSLIAQRLADARHRRVHVTSYGWSGARVADLVRDQVPRSLGPLRDGETAPVLPAADVVVVVIGANDAAHRTAPGSFRADLRNVLATIRSTAPDAELVLAGIPHFRGAIPDVGVLVWIADQYARVLRGIGRREAEAAGAHYADLERDVPPRVDDIDDVLSVDRFHPSLAGYRLWADVITESLATLPPAGPPVPLRTSPLADT
jgi:lysophospholipase L1-like esterase